MKSNERQRPHGRFYAACLCLIFVASALLSWLIRPVSAQFIDRIVRPCATGTARGTVQVTTTNILVNPCPGGSVTVNGVPLVPGAGLPDPGANGIVVRTALNADIARTITVTAPIVIANGNGVAGNPALSCATCGITTNPLSQFAATSSAQFAGVISDESGTGPLIFGTAPVFTNAVRFGTVSSATGQLNLANSGSAFLTTIQAGNAAAARTYTWPINFGAAGAVLTDAAGNGTLSWAVPAVGVTANPTVGTIPYLSAANVYSDSPYTRLSATHVQLFANAAGGFDFDSSAPAITLNATGTTVTITGGTLTIPSLTPNAFIFSGTGGLITATAAPTNGQLLIGSAGAAPVRATPTASAPLGITLGAGTLNFTCATCATGSGTTNLLPKWTNGAGGVLGDSQITDSGTLVSITGELQTPKAIRTGTASNTDVAGSLTVGGGGTVTYTFTQIYVTAPVCVANDTAATPLPIGASASTITLTITGTAAHVATYHCFGLN